MVYTGTNATGWGLLLNGSLVKASFTLFNTTMGGWFIILIFFTYQAMLWMKLQSPATNLLTGLLYMGVYMGTPFFTWTFGWVLALINITFLTMLFYDTFIKNRTGN